jgi:hypothetical protein
LAWWAAQRNRKIREGNRKGFTFFEKVFKKEMKHTFELNKQKWMLQHVCNNKLQQTNMDRTSFSFTYEQ